jgi:hypothetical protein
MGELLVSSTKTMQDYTVYTGDYPVIVIDNPGYIRRDELNLSLIVEQHKLQSQLNSIIWIEHILSHTGLFNKLTTKAESWHVLIVDQTIPTGLRANGEYIIPEKVVKALLSRCKKMLKATKKIKIGENNVQKTDQEKISETKSA